MVENISRRGLMTGMGVGAAPVDTSSWTGNGRAIAADAKVTLDTLLQESRSRNARSGILRSLHPGRT